MSQSRNLRRFLGAQDVRWFLVAGCHIAISVWLLFANAVAQVRGDSNRLAWLLGGQFGRIAFGVLLVSTVLVCVKPRSWRGYPWVVLLGIVPAHAFVEGWGGPKSLLGAGYFLYVFGGAMTGRVPGAVVHLLGALGSIRLQQSMSDWWYSSHAVALVLAAVAAGLLMESYDGQDEFRRALVALIGDRETQHLPEWSEDRVRQAAEVLSADVLVWYVVSVEKKRLLEGVVAHRGFSTRVVDKEGRRLDADGPLLTAIPAANSTEAILPDDAVGIEPEDLPERARRGGRFARCVRFASVGERELFSFASARNKRLRWTRRLLGRRSARKWLHHWPNPRSFTSADRELLRHVADFLGRRWAEERLSKAVEAEQAASRTLLDRLVQSTDLRTEFVHLGEVFRATVGADQALVIAVDDDRCEVVAWIEQPPERRLAGDALLSQCCRTEQIVRERVASGQVLGLGECAERIAVPIRVGTSVSHVLCLGSRDSLVESSAHLDGFLRTVATGLAVALAGEETTRRDEAFASMISVSTVSFEAMKRDFCGRVAKNLPTLLASKAWIFWVADRHARRLVAFLSDPGLQLPSDFQARVDYDDSWLAQYLEGEPAESNLHTGAGSLIRNREVFVRLGYGHFTGAAVQTPGIGRSKAGVIEERQFMGALVILSRTRLSHSEKRQLRDAARALGMAQRTLALDSMQAFFRRMVVQANAVKDPIGMASLVEGYLAKQWPGSTPLCLLRSPRGNRFESGRLSREWCRAFPEPELKPFLEASRRFVGSAEVPRSALVTALERTLPGPVANLVTVPIRSAEGDALGLLLLASTADGQGPLASGYYTPLEEYLLEELVDAIRPTVGRLLQHMSMLELMLTWGHEVKGPIRYARQWAEEIQAGLPLDHSSRPLQSVLDNCDRSLHLIEVLEKARRGTGHMARRGGQCDAVSLLRNVILGAEPVARLAKVRLIEEIDAATAPVAMGDDELYMVVSNLMQNGIKHAGVGGSVRVKLKELANGRFEIALENTGPKVRPDELERLLRPYAQGRMPRGLAEVLGLGMGLGLTIASDRLEESGSVLRVHDIDSGACFVFDLARSTAATGGEAIAAIN